MYNPNFRQWITALALGAAWGCGRAETFLPACDGSAPGVFVLAGGGAEGDDGDTSAWSFQLYRHLIENGDIDRDGVIRVLLVTDEFPDDPERAQALPRYFASIGAALSIPVEAENLPLGSRERANSPEVAAALSRADAVFLKGGDQGIYYDLWNNTLFEETLRASVERCHTAVGGTSAGAMSLSGFSFSGSQDLTSEEALADAQSPLFDDLSEPGTSGIHTDFLNFLPGTLVDTHFTARGRFGRLLTLLAKASDDSGESDILAIGLEERTGLVVRGDIAEVVGTGEVSFLHETPDTERVRPSGRPPRYTNLRLDRLVHGWRYDLRALRPLVEQAPPGTEELGFTGPAAPQASALTILGAQDAEREKFGAVASVFPDEYSLAPTTAAVFLPGTIGFTDAGSFDSRMDKQETLFRALFDQPALVGFLLFQGGALRREEVTPSRVSFVASASEVGALVFDASRATHKGLSPFISNWSAEEGSLQAAAMIGLRAHALSSVGQVRFDLNTRTVEAAAR